MSKAEHYKGKVYGMGHTRLRRILDLVGKKPGQRVLDVGCASGRLGNEVKKFGNYVVGVEISPVAAEEARKVLAQVFAFDIEKPWPDIGGQFDLVILPEILEHVFDPLDILLEANKFLKPDGSLIITTPNFMTWTNRLRFLFGDFKYQEQGMFDFGHIRWFTYSYLKEVLQKTGFQITDERHIIFPGKLTSLLKRWPGVFAFQFIVKARKE